MVNYRRVKLSGGKYFFTVTLRDRQSDLLIKHVDVLRYAMKQVQQRRPFFIEAIAILPDHLHAIWQMPLDEYDYSKRWAEIKGTFTRELIKQGYACNCNKDGVYKLWQRRFWEHTIRDERDLQKHIDYIHYNPVKHGYVVQPADWPYSSFHRYLSEGKIEPDWMLNVKIAADYGE